MTDKASPTNNTATKRKPLFGVIPRIPEWSRNTLANVTGGSVRKHGEFLNGAIDAARAAYKPHGYIKETFEEAIARLELTDAQLVRRRWELTVTARGFFAGALVVFGIGAWYAMGGMLLQTLAAGAMAAVAVVSGLARTFRVWQISIRRLAKFKEFMSHAEAWIV